MMTLLFLATCFLAYSNGANDNFKGVASIYGSRTASYRTALTWATLTTGAGSIAAIFLAQALLKKFSGKGLVPDALTTEPAFLLAVALGAGVTVILATILGFPISTTHGLTGALVGAGLVSGGTGNVNFSSLGKGFVFPLLISPLLAVVAGASVYGLFRALHLRLGVSQEGCLCIGAEKQIVPVPQLNGVFAAEALPSISISTGEPAACVQRYTGTFFGVKAGGLVDALHFLSAGAVSFARGLNDTPKLAALLLVITAIHIQFGLLAVSLGMALGGLLNAWKVADTMANKITEMNAGQGLSANLATALLVNTASYHGLPVSTTHVSVGSLIGIGLTTGKAKWKPVLAVLLSWVITLPCAAMVGAVAYLILKLFA